MPGRPPRPASGRTPCCPQCTATVEGPQQGCRHPSGPPSEQSWRCSPRNRQQWGSARRKPSRLAHLRFTRTVDAFRGGRSSVVDGSNDHLQILGGRGAWWSGRLLASKRPARKRGEQSESTGPPVGGPCGRELTNGLVCLTVGACAAHACVQHVWIRIVHDLVRRARSCQPRAAWTAIGACTR